MATFKFCDKREQLSLLKLLSEAKILSEANNSQFSTLNSQFFRQRLKDLRFSTFIVAPLGLEPRHTEPESAVLPLHNRAVEKSCSIGATFCFIWFIIQAC